jgi:Tol biopolymer transport system component
MKKLRERFFSDIFLVFFLLISSACTPSVGPPEGLEIEGRLIFSSIERTGSELRIVNADGTGLETLEDESEGNRFHPSVSPDGYCIAYTNQYVREAFSPYNAQLFVMASDGTNVQAWVSNSGGSIEAVAWSPDGTCLAFSGNINSDIYTVCSGTISLLTDYANTGTRSTDPAWSPDSQQIAYSIGTGIYIMDSDGANKHPLEMLLFSFSTRDPNWSPDGSKLVFIAEDGANEQIFTIPVEPTVIGDSVLPATYSQLTNFEAGKRVLSSPVWSPDGNYISFSYRENDNWDVYIMEADGENLFRVTNSSADEIQASWFPVNAQPETFCHVESRAPLESSEIREIIVSACASDSFALTDTSKLPACRTWVESLPEEAMQACYRAPSGFNTILIPGYIMTCLDEQEGVDLPNQ